MLPISNNNFQNILLNFYNSIHADYDIILQNTCLNVTKY